MNWKSIDELPEKEGEYLLCGDEIERKMKNGDPPDTYCIGYFNSTYKSWCPYLHYNIEIKEMYWCELPEFPKADCMKF